MPAITTSAGSERGVSRTLALAALVALLGLLGYLAATGGPAYGSTKATVSLHATSDGKVLIAANGRSLYMFTADKHGKSVCKGQCAAFWPPLIAASRPTAGAGVHASLLGRTRRADGRMQVTYAGHPLYFFVKDTKSGEVEGEGIVHFGGSWWLVSGKGSAVKASSSGGTTTTSSTTTTNYQPPPTPGY
jgi:predicted lipoprotein with Yx(FWY)xxD motif